MLKKILNKRKNITSIILFVSADRDEVTHHSLINFALLNLEMSLLD